MDVSHICTALSQTPARFSATPVGGCLMYAHPHMELPSGPDRAYPHQTHPRRDKHNKAGIYRNRQAPAFLVGYVCAP